jgi:hypothetical protein
MKELDLYLRAMEAVESLLANLMLAVYSWDLEYTSLKKLS